MKLHARNNWWDEISEISVMCLLGDKQLTKTVTISSRRGLYFVTKQFNEKLPFGVKGSQDRCQDNYYQIRVKPPVFCVGYNNDRKREYVCAM